MGKGGFPAWPCSLPRSRLSRSCWLTFIAPSHVEAAVRVAEGRVLRAGSQEARGWGRRALPPLASHVLGTPGVEPRWALWARACQRDGDGNR